MDMKSDTLSSVAEAVVNGCAQRKSARSCRRPWRKSAPLEVISEVTPKEFNKKLRDVGQRRKEAVVPHVEVQHVLGIEREGTNLEAHGHVLLEESHSEVTRHLAHDAHKKRHRCENLRPGNRGSLRVAFTCSIL